MPEIHQLLLWLCNTNSSIFLLKMTHVKDGQKLQQHRKLSKRCISSMQFKANAQMTFTAMFGPIQEGFDCFCATICHHGSTNTCQ